MKSEWTLDLKEAVSEEALESSKEKALEAFDTLLSREGAGNDFLGWIDLPVDYDKEEFSRIQKAAEFIRREAEVLLVIGIGGSYLGARAVVEALTPSYGTQKPEILFAGNHLSAQETVELLSYLKDKIFAINVISKSGTTTEPAIAFRLFRDLLEEKVGKEKAKELIFATTDREKGALKQVAEEAGYETFVVPDDVGGRFSVLTAVGLLPIAAAGIDIAVLMQGAADIREKALAKDFESNLALRYAATRLALIEAGKQMEILVSYEPKMRYFEEWWKQLAGESEGKENRGLYPSSVGNTTDLHSLGQWIQEGPRMHFETVLWFRESVENVTVPDKENNADGLNYLAGKDLHYVNEQAMRGTRQAHVDGQVPNILLTVPKLDTHTLGELIYFYEVAIGVSGYGLGINPFNQPGVEFYKKNMFHLLEKPGY